MPPVMYSLPAISFSLTFLSWRLAAARPRFTRRPYPRYLRFARGRRVAEAVTHP